MRFTLLLSAALLPLAANAQAQETAAPAGENTAADAEPIIVTAARTALPLTALPLTAEVIDRETLERQLQISGSVVDAVAARIPSFSPARQKLTGQGETLRGRSPLFAIDGIPQTAPLRDGSRDGFTIDPFFIDRVELILGSNALQGIGGTGGVINQVTVSAPAEDGWSARTILQGTAESGFRDDGFGGKVGALIANRSGAFDVVVGAAYERRGVFRDGEQRRIAPDGTQGDLQDSESLSFFAKAGVELGETVQIEAMGQRFELQGDGDLVAVAGSRATGLPATGAPGVVQGEAPENLAESLSLTLTADDLAGGALRVRGFWNRTADIYGGGIFADFQDPAIAPLGTLFDQSQNISRKWGINASWERGFGPLNLVAGVDLLNDHTVQVLAQTGRAWVPPTDYRSIAPFAQGNLALWDGKLRLAGGVRWENVEISIDDYQTLFFYGPQQVGGGSPSFDRVLPNGGIVIEPTPGIRAYASYAQGYTVPDVGRITRAIRTPDVDLDRFLDIAPVVADNREVGIEVNRGPIEASATYFWSDSDEGQLLVLVGDVFEVQRQRIEIQGLELNLSTATPIPGLRLGFGYAHLDGRVDTDGDGIVNADLDGANIGPDRLNLWADYAIGPVSLGLQSRTHFARRFDGGDPRNDFEGYHLLDGSMSVATGFGRFTLAAQNLLDRQYIDYNSDTQRPADNLRFFAGRGRSVTLGWLANF
ncbi:TonB-dependent receptor [Erythrobacter donghaensis]|jgi:iron complex outermembrane receptor protein|uniref:TonB-dependent receptor n=1 Tax=Erythrobacter donghaensis TaxID=267135 RepID=UPI00093CD335|nr:TonB-dependent receptor [Erythrobacter donghaensis]